MSKELIEDDYIANLRLESYQLSIFIVIVGAMLFSIFGSDTNVEISNIIVLVLLMYLLVFAIKKELYNMKKIIKEERGRHTLTQAGLAEVLGVSR